MAMMLVATLCLGFYSCDKDNENDEISTSDLVGTWQRTRLIYRFTDSDGKVTDSKDRDETNSEAPARYEFRSDGIITEGFWLGSGYSEDGYWEGYYKVENNELYLSETKEFKKENELYYTIIELSDNRLVLEGTEEDNKGGYYEKATYKRVK